MRMGATHFLMKTLPKAASEMALHMPAYNFNHVMDIIGIKPLMAADRAFGPHHRQRAIRPNPYSSVFTRPRPNADAGSLARYNYTK